MALFSWLARLSPTAAEVRAEVWKLGVRHHGEPLEGARQELSLRGLAPSRAALLKACVRALSERGGATMATASPPAW
jgi:hypothetical protein